MTVRVHRMNIPENRTMRAPYQENKQENTIAFKIDPKITKPELHQYLQKLYGFNIEKINTVVRMGRFKFDRENGS